VKIGDPTTKDELIYHWLRSEWHKIPVAGPADVDLIATGADRTDVAENQRRCELLLLGGKKIIGTLPDNCTYDFAEIEPGDIGDLFVIPLPGWYLDTGRSFSLHNTLTHLKGGRAACIAGNLTPFATACEIAACRDYMAAHGTSREFLILTATNRQPRYTIIDGTHRAVALLQMSESKPAIYPWTAILVSSPDMRDCQWHIDSSYAQNLLSSCADWESRGLLW
jgi:hypothetical protein